LTLPFQSAERPYLRFALKLYESEDFTLYIRRHLIEVNVQRL
jgi:hypothetical protein